MQGRTVRSSRTATIVSATPANKREGVRVLKQHTIVESRAADVIVIGDSTVAAATTFSLARRGKKVIYLRDEGITAKLPTPEALKPLHVPDLSQDLTHLGWESAQYWYGLQTQAAAQLLWPCKTMDLILSGSSSSSSNGDLVARLLEACKAVGAKADALVAQQVAEKWRTVRPPNGAVCVQAPGAVINQMAAYQALCLLAERAGALVKDRLMLKGWKDLGSHFTIKASSSLQPDAVSIYEAEQIVLAPGTCAPAVLQMFGLPLGLQVTEYSYARCIASQDLAKMPLTRVWGSTNSADTSAAGGTTSYEFQAFPMVNLSGKVKLCQPAAKGKPVEDLWSWAHQPSRDSMLRHQWQAAALFPGLGGVDLTTLTTNLSVSFGDGLPIVGFHPGFDEGRVVMATALSGCSSSKSLAFSGADGYQLSPVLARYAADMLVGLHLNDIDPAKLQPGRLLQRQPDPHSEGVADGSSGASPTTPHPTDASLQMGLVFDTWDELSLYQSGRHLQPSQENALEAAEAARVAEKEHAADRYKGTTFLTMP